MNKGDTKRSHHEDGHLHDHDHTHNHMDDDHETHAHDHTHGHEHTHEHECDHEHDHTHDDTHEHDHDHSHGHEHDHDHSHGHEHDYTPDHEHEHDHSHGHSHGFGHGHDHTHGMAKHTLRLAFFLTIFILLAGYIGGFVANSLALLSDASHSLTDLFALGLAWFAAAQAERPPNHRKTFGYHRVGILVALVNAVSLILIAGSILWEAIQRFQHPEPVQPLVIFVSATIAIGINLFIAFGLRKEGGDNLNARVVSLHVLGDVAASVGVIIGGLVILLTGWEIVDPLLSVGIAILVAVGSWHILTETVDILLEAVPRNISMDRLVYDMTNVPGVQAVHDLHIWSIASGINALSCHVLIDDLPPSDSSPILQSLTTLLRKKYHIEHATIQFECDFHEATFCGQTELYCQLSPKSGDAHSHGH